MMIRPVIVWQLALELSFAGLGSSGVLAVRVAVAFSGSPTVRYGKYAVNSW
jgi:hypothetical protein